MAKTNRITLEPGLDVDLHAHEFAVGGRALQAWTLVARGLSVVES